ncbi:hypothetical protein INR49_014163 [Caranx melampygus]|nr:hypothetical protein INR49_014163 [Caranx melampygus]
MRMKMAAINETTHSFLRNNMAGRTVGGQRWEEGCCVEQDSREAMQDDDRKQKIPVVGVFIVWIFEIAMNQGSVALEQNGAAHSRPKPAQLFCTVPTTASALHLRPVHTSDYHTLYLPGSGHDTMLKDNAAAGCWVVSTDLVLIAIDVVDFLSTHRAKVIDCQTRVLLHHVVFHMWKNGSRARRSNIPPRPYHYRSLLAQHVSSEDGKVMAALGPNLDCHALVVACHQSVQESPSLLGKALFSFVDGASALDGLTAIPTETNLSDHTLKELGHVVLQRCRCLYELTVKYHCARSALWEKSNFSGPHKVALVAHKNDGKVFSLTGASQSDAELSSRVKGGAQRFLQGSSFQHHGHQAAQLCKHSPIHSVSRRLSLNSSGRGSGGTCLRDGMRQIVREEGAYAGDVAALGLAGCWWGSGNLGFSFSFWLGFHREKHLGQQARQAKDSKAAVSCNDNLRSRTHTCEHTTPVWVQTNQTREIDVVFDDHDVTRLETGLVLRHTPADSNNIDSQNDQTRDGQRKNTTQLDGGIFAVVIFHKASTVDAVPTNWIEKTKKIYSCTEYGEKDMSAAITSEMGESVHVHKLNVMSVTGRERCS